MGAARLGAIVIGVALAAVAQVLALGMTGAGHGWITPFLFSPALFVLNPIALVRLKAGGARPITGDVVLIVIAAILDVALFSMTAQEGVQYFGVVSPFNWLWLILWSLWQVAIVGKLAIRFAPHTRSTEG